MAEIEILWKVVRSKARKNTLLTSYAQQTQYAVKLMTTHFAHRVWEFDTSRQNSQCGGVQGYHSKTFNYCLCASIRGGDLQKKENKDGEEEEVLSLLWCQIKNAQNFKTCSSLSSSPNYNFWRWVLNLPMDSSICKHRIQKISQALNLTFITEFFWTQAWNLTICSYLTCRTHPALSEILEVRKCWSCAPDRQQGAKPSQRHCAVIVLLLCEHLSIQVPLTVQILQK